MSGVLKVVRATGLLRAVSHAPGTQVRPAGTPKPTRVSTRSAGPILAHTARRVQNFIPWPVSTPLVHPGWRYS